MLQYQQKTSRPLGWLAEQHFGIDPTVIEDAWAQQYAGFTLSLFSSLAVSCVIVLRIRRPELERPFRAWGYPVTPLLFLGVSGWMMYWAMRGRPFESVLALLTVLLGGLIFAVTVSRQKPERR